jgi:Tfp pilus assembly protein PilP
MKQSVVTSLVALLCATGAYAQMAQAPAALKAAKSAKSAVESASSGGEAATSGAAGASAPAAPGSTSQGTDAASSSGGAAIEAPAPAGFTYNPEGRRDPFVSLARRGLDTRTALGPRPAGLAGLDVSEVSLRGTLRSKGEFVAMLQGSDRKTYIVRPGDKLFDATVRSISQNDVVFLQQITDPLSSEKQREVRKGLRQVEAN